VLCRALRAKRVALHLFHVHAETLFLLRVFPQTARKLRADDRTRTADLVSLRVINHALQRFAKACKFLRVHRGCSQEASPFTGEEEWEPSKRLQERFAIGIPFVVGYSFG
jgi:hypothetical protein